jgi:hypothetical protein
VEACRRRKKVEMLFAHLKRLVRWRLRGPNGANNEFLLAATAQNLRRLARLRPINMLPENAGRITPRMPEKTESPVNEALGRIQAMNGGELQRVTDCSWRVRWARLPIVQYCLGLKRTASQNSEDPFQPQDDEMRIKREAMDRLRAMLTDDWAKVSACGKRVEAAGGLAAIDPVGEMERINRIPAVQDASKQYSGCVIGRAVQMARVSEEPAETIARAALSGCALLRQQYLAVMARELDITMTPERAAEEEKETTGAVVGQIIAARAAAAGTH